MAQWTSNEEITAAKLNARRGFPSRVRARSSLSLQFANAVAGAIDFDTVDFDGNSEFDSANRTSTNTSTASNKLIDTSGAFTSADLYRWVYNTVTYKYARITNIDSSTQVSISGNIFPSSSTAYRLFGTNYTAKVAGYYQINFQVAVSGTVSNAELLEANIYVNGSLVNGTLQSSVGTANAATLLVSDLIHLSIGDLMYFTFNNQSPNTKIINGGTTSPTIITIQLVSED